MSRPTFVVANSPNNLDRVKKLQFYVTFSKILCSTSSLIYLKQDMEKLENVQRRTTNMIQGSKDLSWNG